MSENVNKKELPDEALDRVSGGTSDEELIKAIMYRNAFCTRNNCIRCQIFQIGNCAYYDMGPVELSNTFGGDPNAKCPNFKSI